MLKEKKRSLQFPDGNEVLLKFEKPDTKRKEKGCSSLTGMRSYSRRDGISEL